MAEHRQAESRLGDEHVAGDRLERQAGRIGDPLVVARHHDPAAAILDRHLGAAEHVAGRLQPELHVAQRQDLSPARRLSCASGAALPHPDLHDRQRRGAGQHRAVSGPGMVGMGVGDDGALHRLHRIDEESTRLAPQAFGAHLQPGFGMGHRLATPVAPGRLPVSWTHAQQCCHGH
jgi:hypothetical protein